MLVKVDNFKRFTEGIIKVYIFNNNYYINIYLLIYIFFIRNKQSASAVHCRLL